MKSEMFSSQDASHGQTIAVADLVMNYITAGSLYGECLKLFNSLCDWK